MCARYTMTRTDAAELCEEFDIKGSAPETLEPHFNLAPTMDAPIVTESRDLERHIVLARFGLVPHWAEDTKIGARLLNARVESVADKPAFRDALARHRCLVVADGFFEWRREGKLKIPFYFQLPDHRPFGFAGLWAVWRDARGGRITSFTIVTGPAEETIAPIHDRMPIIIKPEDYAAWLDRRITDADEVLPILERSRALELSSFEVSRRVNYVKNDDPECIEPVSA